MYIYTYVYIYINIYIVFIYICIYIIIINHARLMRLVLCMCVLCVTMNMNKASIELMRDMILPEQGGLSPCLSTNTLFMYYSCITIYFYPFYPCNNMTCIRVVSARMSWYVIYMISRYRTDHISYHRKIS